MHYWVHEYWRAQGHVAAIHRAGCGHCKNGTGVPLREIEGQKETWHGPFMTFKEAEEAAIATGGRVKRHRCCLL
ncbi:MAG TPA: hypothetical protein VMS89_04135 [Methanoregulaceae archaeon]|nr:hypothetical protein [Methanoregulaceae archaeon]